MTEPYKPWEGKHFKEAQEKMTCRITSLLLLYPSDSDVARHIRGIEYIHTLLLEALKKDWCEQGNV